MEVAENECISSVDELSSNVDELCSKVQIISDYCKSLDGQLGLSPSNGSDGFVELFSP